MKRGPFRSGKKPAIWPAIAVAIALHAIFLLLPVMEKKQAMQNRQPALEIELTAVEMQPPDSVARTPEPEIRIPVKEPAPEVSPPPALKPPENFTAAQPVEALEAQATTINPDRVDERDYDKLSEVEKKVLTSTILARQYITEESAVDRLFGKPLVQASSDVQKDFHYPLRKDLIEMLDRPLPDLPFEYTPGLVYFAYDPGLRGDLQRFWDVITPEFGWRTKYGTEVKCALILIIPGCVWK